ncbi:MAG TPA: hypothetical protein P5277_03965 [Candidatus Paceibacterota bacterium]|nr:hypothetical protein [Candidatus Paceibacterota bacterium]
MNFRPTIWKSIVSLIVSVCISLPFSKTCYYLHTFEDGCTNLFNYGKFVIILIPIFLLFYSLWSLVEKK